MYKRPDLSGMIHELIDTEIKACLDDEETKGVMRGYVIAQKQMLNNALKIYTPIKAAEILAPIMPIYGNPEDLNDTDAVVADSLLYFMEEYVSKKIRPDTDEDPGGVIANALNDYEWWNENLYPDIEEEEN